MNKYIVATEKSQEIVYADEVLISGTVGLTFRIARPPSGPDLQAVIVDTVAAFKVYEYFLLDEEDVVKPEECTTLNDLKVGDEIRIGSMEATITHEPVNDNPKPWKIPLKDIYDSDDKSMPYGRVFNHINNGEPVTLIFESEEGEQSFGCDYLINKEANINPETGEYVKIITQNRYCHPLTWAYYDKDGNLERAEIR